MQYGFSDPAKATRTPRAESDEAISSESASGIVAEIVGERKRVLDLGCGKGELARQLARRECDIVGIDINPASIEEARAFCTRAIVADIDGVPLPELVGDQPFDVVVLGDVLPYLRQPTRLLDGARDMLRDGGYVVASIPNVSHGAIRLALLAGQFDRHDETGDEGGLRHFTAKTIDELFVSAGYRIDSLARTTSPIFEAVESLPQVERSDFEASVVEQIERDPEATTLQFVVRAAPLSNDAKHRAIVKRFLTANTELAAALIRLEKRDREIERLTSVPTALEAVPDPRFNALTERAHHAEVEAARLEERLSADSTLVKDLASALEAKAAIHENLMIVTEELERFRTALTTERVEWSELKVAAATHEQQLAPMVERVAQLEAELAAVQVQYGNAVQALTFSQARLQEATTRADETTSLLEVADVEIARLISELELAHERVESDRDLRLQTILVEASHQSEEIERLNRDLLATRRSSALLVDQLYDEIRLINESRAVARDEAIYARRCLVRDTAALSQEVERLEGEARSLRIKVLSTTRAHFTLEAEFGARIETVTVALLAMEEERDAERAARVAGDEQQQRFRAALVDERIAAEALKEALAGAEERFKALEVRFINQTQSLLDQTRGEAARVELLISTVHSSSFWRLKAAFARLIGR